MLTRLANRRRGRSGITLTEILISIMILGVGMLSLATLFPLGLIRIRNAQRLTRSSFLVESASSDLAARNLLAKLSFSNIQTAPWYNAAGMGVYGRYDPWVQDTPSYGADWGVFDTTIGRYTTFYGAKRGYGGQGVPDITSFDFTPGESGLPVAYDPLWRAVANVYPAPVPTGIGVTEGEARFGSGVGFIRDDPNPGPTRNTASVWGLQRVTNFCTYSISGVVPLVTAASNYRTVLGTFVSPEDLVMQEPNGQYPDPNNASGQITAPSPVIPDLSIVDLNAPLPLSNGVMLYPAQNDWRFTWMFTGQRSDATDGATYDGNIVIHENRQFSLDLVQSPLPSGGTVAQPAGETVVEAIWGYSATAGQQIGTTSIGYGNLSSNRTVVLRWPDTMPDPDVRVGGWIADVTYERSEVVSRERTAVPVASPGPGKVAYPTQRCYWYQVAKKTEPTVDSAGYRRMSVWVTSQLRAKTPINFGVNPPAAYHVEAALIAPTVVHVYPWSGIIR